MPIASYSALAITRPLPTRLERTITGLAAADPANAACSVVFSAWEINPAPVPANTMPRTPPETSARITVVPGSTYE